MDMSSLSIDLFSCRPLLLSDSVQSGGGYGPQVAGTVIYSSSSPSSVSGI